MSGRQIDRGSTHILVRVIDSTSQRAVVRCRGAGAQKEHVVEAVDNEHRARVRTRRAEGE